jgi:hypothetical protein
MTRLRSSLLVGVLAPVALTALFAPRPLRADTQAAPAATMVDLNTASDKDLEALPGVGPATAKKIVAGRPYASVDDLKKAGVHPSTIEKIRSKVTVSAVPAAPAAATPAPAVASPAPSPASPAPSPAATAKPAKTTTTAASPTQPQQPPAPGMVWVNTSTKVFHREGDKWFGNTKKGKFMTEADAVKAGYHESGASEKPKAQTQN